MVNIPNISVIVPVYNTEQYLRRCIDSVLAQTYKDFELLLIDDGSKDSSGAICDEYAAQDTRVRVFHKENGGLTSARNYGLDHAVGHWITHVDSDDWIEKEMFAEMLAKADGAEVVFCDFYFCEGEKRRHYHNVDWNDEDKVNSLNRYITSGFTSACGVLAKRNLYEIHNLKSPSGITYCEDFHLMVRLCYFAKGVVHIGKPYYNYRQHQTSLLHSGSSKEESDNIKVNYDIIGFFKSQGVYDSFSRSMCWRMIRTTQDMVLDSSRWDEFRSILPEKRRYIYSCPYLNKKIRINMWCVTHHLSFISHIMLWARTIKKDYISR